MIEPTAEQLSLFLKVVNDPANHPVYVHCAGGRHRTGVMTAVYRMHHDKWTAEQAFKEMKQYKFGADFLHPEFKRFAVRLSSRTSGGTCRACYRCHCQRAGSGTIAFANGVDLAADGRQNEGLL